MIESFQLQFSWHNDQRELKVQPATAEAQEFISLYQIFRNDVYLFSLFPVINKDCCKVWEIVEKDREAHLPIGFIEVLGNMIDLFYMSGD
jgi:hypothetical protein